MNKLKFSRKMLLRLSLRTHPPPERTFGTGGLPLSFEEERVNGAK